MDWIGWDWIGWDGMEWDGMGYMDGWIDRLIDSLIH